MIAKIRPTKSSSSRKTILIALGLFLIALAVRVPGLDSFFTADEFLWVDRSRNFLGGLISPEFECLLPDQDKTNALPGKGLACTLRTGHPGVMTMWTGALGIWLQWLTRPAADARSLLEFVQQLPTNPVQRSTIGPVRLPMAIITSLFIGVFYLLLRRLFKAEVALLAALLVALNPFHIALSRVLHHDALSTCFIITSSLSLMIYYGVERRRRWLLLAGGLAGLAMLTKSTGFFLIPYAGLLGLWSLLAGWAREEEAFGRAVGRSVADGLLWLGMAVLTFFLVWPAMWVIPAKVLTTIFVIGFKYAGGGHAKGVLFLGDVSRDPGPFFYPVTWLFRTHFWSMAGIVAAAGLAVGALRKRASRQPSVRGWLDKFSPRGFGDKTGLLLWVSAFLFFFLLAMVLVEKKQGRYVLPIYPMLDLIAAAGLFTLLRRAVAQRLLLAGVVVLNLALILPRYPYYFSYYNPLAGGIRTASRAITVGWGEGLNLAAAYLNTKPNAEALHVSSWYGSTFAPFFKGTTIRYSDQKGNALGGDYVIFYLNQQQRSFPDEEIWRYVNENFALDRVISLDGMDYAWIFSGPHIGHYLEDQRYTGIAALLGWDWGGATNPDNGPVAAGSDLTYSLFWEYLGKTPAEDFFFRLIGPDGRIWSETASRPTAQFSDTAAWRQGQIIEEQGTLHIPPDTPPGTYDLQIGFYTAAPAVTGGELIFPTLNQPLDAPLQKIEVTPSGKITNEPGTPLFDLALLNPAPDAFESADEALSFDLTWVAPQGTGQVYQAAFALLDPAGEPRWRWESRSLIEFLPTSDWPPGQALRSRWRLPFDQRTPGGRYALQVQLVDDRGRVAPFNLGEVDIPGRVRDFAPPQPLHSLQAIFDQSILLSGFDLSQPDLQPGQRLDLTLYWQSLSFLNEDYTVFLQLLGPDGQVYAQQDAPPLDGEAPTSTWTPGEVLADVFTLTLPGTLPPGDYELITGFYQFETGWRLTANQAGNEDDFVLLHRWSQ